MVRPDSKIKQLGADRQRLRSKLKKAENGLTAKGRLVSTVGAVRSVVTHCGEVYAHTVAGTLPLPAWTPERWCGTISFITHVPAVVVPIANPTAKHAVSVIATEQRGRAGARWAGVVLVTAILAVWMTVTLP